MRYSTCHWTAFTEGVVLAKKVRQAGGSAVIESGKPGEGLEGVAPVTRIVPGAMVPTCGGRVAGLIKSGAETPAAAPGVFPEFRC